MTAVQLAYEDHMIVQNPLVLVLVPVKLGDLPETIKHTLYDPVVR